MLLPLSFKERKKNLCTFEHPSPSLAGSKKDYLNIAIKNGAILLTINLGSGSYEEVVPKDGSTRLDDNRWHHVVVRRAAREVSCLEAGVDGFIICVCISFVSR